MSILIPKINKDFHQKLLSNDDDNLIRRADNRILNEYRPISINHITSSFNSPIRVNIGNTSIISQINAKLVKPKQERPSEGIISFSVDTRHLKANADFTSSNEALNELRISINNILEKCLKQSHALDSNILCVIPGKLVWKIILEINVIKNDGNLFDASIISALCSWLTYKIPFFRIKGQELYYDSFINLTTIHMPICITNGIFLKKNKNEDVIFILDNNLEEESILSGNVSICANIFGEISYMQMNTEAQIGLEDMEKLINSTETNVEFLHKKIKNFVEQENKRVENLIKSMKIKEKNDEMESNNNNLMEVDDENNKKQIQNMMIIEENNGKSINILEKK